MTRRQQLTQFLEEELGGWFFLLEEYVTTDRFLKILARFQKIDISPEFGNIFKAFKLCQPDNIKIVLLGMDPYPYEATGLSFGSTKLKSLLKVMLTSMYGSIPDNYDYSLESWAGAGVLLMNSSLTTVLGETGSHIGDWLPFTHFLYRKFRTESEFDKLIFIHLGSKASAFNKHVEGTRHILIQGSHPSVQLYGGPKFNGDHLEPIKKLLENGYL